MIVRDAGVKDSRAHTGHGEFSTGSTVSSLPKPASATTFYGETGILSKEIFPFPKRGWGLVICRVRARFNSLRYTDGVSNPISFTSSCRAEGNIALSVLDLRIGPESCLFEEKTPLSIKALAYLKTGFIAWIRQDIAMDESIKLFAIVWGCGAVDLSAIRAGKDVALANKEPSS